MGGCSWEVISPRTVVMVGKTSNGKSATGNNILGMKVLLSKRSSSGVTVSSELQTTKFDDGQILNVIDTPGLFDSSLDFEFIGKEIVKCINMAPDGVDAFLVVVSTLTRFSEEEKAAIKSLQTLFGRKVYDYMILVFTGGDELEDDNQTLEDFLRGSPELLKETLRLCGNRYVIFNNKTDNETKRLNRVNELLFLINTLSEHNGGKLYTNEMFTETKNQTKELTEPEIPLDDQRFKHIHELIESKLKEKTSKLEQQLAEERVARVKAVEQATAAQKKADDEMQKIKEKLKKTEKKSMEICHKMATDLLKKSEEEKRKLKKKLAKEENLRKRKEKELRDKEAYWQQRGEELSHAASGCFIL